MSIWWLSFADPDRPQGERFLGVSLIEIEDEPGADLRDRIKAVIRKSWATGCNPGGEVQSLELHLDLLSNDKRVVLAKAPRHTLLQKADLEHYGFI